MELSMVRPYEMSLWTLQDSFITVLKGIGVSSQGQLITPEMTVKSDGTQELKFSIPMYCRNDTGELAENPIWYNTENGNLVVNLRKIKVIFNKGEKGVEEVYEFIITKIKETHSKGQLTCEVEAEGLAFQELGKTGYKLVLNYDEFIIDADNDVSLIPTLQYWADKIFTNSDWTYSIQMDWSAYDGFIDDVDYENLSSIEKDEINNAREAKGLRRRDRMYEEGYVVTWEYNALSNLLTPKEIENFQEKARTPELEKSNRYNLTQSLAELFGVFCKYKYYYDSNYHIIGKECIFYNNFFGEDEEKIDINYPYNTNEISREGESNDVITKMYVVPIDDIGIQNVSANKSGEDYILNFDYLHDIGTITDEQYKEIDIFETKMFSLNQEAKSKSEEKIKKEQDLTEAEASLAVAKNSMIYAEEQIDKARQIKNSLAEDGKRKKTKTAPLQVYIYDAGGSYAVRSLGIEGVEPETIEIYTKCDRAEGIPDNSPRIYFDPETNTEYDKTTKKNLESIKGLRYFADDLGNVDTTKPIEKGMKAYIVCEYNPGQKYQNIIDTYTTRAAADQVKIDTHKAEIELLEAEIAVLEEQLQTIYDKQEVARTDFERMMGPALREGSWQAEEYSDSGDKYYAEISIGEEDPDKLIRGFWDNELFDDEEYNYETISILERKEYYPAIDISNALRFSDLATQIGNEKLCLKYEVEMGNTTESKNIIIGSQMKYGIVRYNGSIIPILYITKSITDVELAAIKTTGRLGVLSYKNDPVSETVKETFTEAASNAYIKDAFISESETVYPRFEIMSDNLREEDEELKVKVFKDNYSHPLKKYNDYYILFRDDSYFITIKPEIYIKYWGMETFILNYIISNASLRLYLDALEVSKTNAYPQVSYKVSITALNNTLVKTIYKKLNKLTMINDTELKFKNVQGYISELKLKLETPWEDEITIQNYKTKFEDLFSRIVASTETLKANTMIYNRAANAFTSSGLITSQVIQSTLSRVDLNYAFNNGKLTINEKEGIWGISDSGVVAIRGGGIFCATEQDFDGNWIWHTGIVPEGINASLLTAGVIDTNVIRIFAGDNIRFQMNGEGLYSFGEDIETGETDFNNYVVQSSEGLFLIKKTDKLDDEGFTVSNYLRRVEISWDGFILRNDDGEMVFYADPDTGKLVVKGEIYADAGVIGGWLIDENFLMSKEEQKEVLYDETTGDIKVDDDGNQVFGNTQIVREVGLGSNPNKNNKVDDSTVYNAIWAGRTTTILEDGTYQTEDAFLVKSDGEVQADFIKANHITSNTLAAGGLYIADGVLYKINTPIIKSLRGEIFQWELGAPTPHNETLKFNILTGNIEDLDNNSWILYRTTDLEGTWEEVGNLRNIEGANFDVNSLTFLLKYDIMKFGENMRDVVYIKLKNGDKESEPLTLYNMYDGMEGVADFVILRSTDVAFYLQEDETYAPEEIIIHAELHGSLTGTNDYWVRSDAPSTHITESSITITPSDFTESSITYTYHCEKLKKDYSLSIYKIRDGKDGETPLTVLITSSRGNVIRYGQTETTLTARIFKGETEIVKTEDAEESYFFKWTRTDLFDTEDKDGDGDTTELEVLAQGEWVNTLQVQAADFFQSATFNCEVSEIRR